MDVKGFNLIILASTNLPTFALRNYNGKEMSYWCKDNILMFNHENFQRMSLGPKHKNKQEKSDVINNDTENHS